MMNEHGERYRIPDILASVLLQGITLNLIQKNNAYIRGIFTDQQKVVNW